MTTLSKQSIRVGASIVAAIFAINAVGMTPVAASGEGASVLDAMTLIEPANGESLPVSEVGIFSAAGGTAVIEPGSPSEELVTYTGVDATTSSLLGLVRTSATDHPAGAPVAASTPSPCEMLADAPGDGTRLGEECETVEGEVNEVVEGLLEPCTGDECELLEPCTSDECELLEPCTGDECELPELCTGDDCELLEPCTSDDCDEVCTATNDCDLSEPVEGVDVDATDAVIGATPDHGNCTASSGGVFRSGNFIGGDGSFDCTANQHFIVTVNVIVKVKTAGVWDEFAIGGAAAESSCCIAAAATAACSPGTNFKYRVVTAGKAANSDGDVVHEDKDRGWDTVDRVECPGSLSFLQ